ncbi:MAG TPA: GAF domain-containing sensor histidine kinase [Longimicrobium sp.]|nr:GAF domain-containing sensor histidine kinase [Longimicrobium sp.]
MLSDAPSTHAPDADAPDGDALRRRVRELEALRRMAVAAAATVDPDEVFRAVCDVLPALVEADFAVVVLPLFDEARRWCAERSPPREVAARLDELAREAAAAGETLVAGAVDDDGEALPPHRAVPSCYGVAEAVAVPLRGEGAEGALLVGWLRRGALPAAWLRVAATVGAQAEVAFGNAARYEALRQAAVRRDRFFSAMSHDLRTPITAIVGYSELLVDGIMGELGPRQQEMVERISQVSGHLSQLVNDILDLARLDAGRMELHRESVELGDVLDEAVVTVEPQARSKGLELVLDIGAHRGAPLHVDPPRVRQILVNLLSNAVKFTERGQVRVVAGADGGRGWIEVRDTGPGIPPGAEEAVFEEFLQLASGPGSRATREPGTGLGLAIARRLARAMGGDLTARNAAEGGACFTLYLPAGPEGEA